MAWLRRRWLWLVLVASLAFNAGMGTTFGVRALDRRCGGPCPSGGYPDHAAILAELDLSPEQLAQAEAESGMLHADVRELCQALAVARITLADLLLADEPDQDAIADQLDTLASLDRQKQQHMVDHILRFSRILNDEQRDVFGNIVRRVFARCGEGYGDLGGHGGCAKMQGANPEGPCPRHKPVQE